MALNRIHPTTNGVGKRKLASWIESFVKQTADMESPEICRRWTAIGAISCMLERKVFVVSPQSILYPNQYIWLVTPAGVGKSSPITTVRRYFEQIKEVWIAPTSVTSASLTDFMHDKAKRTIVCFPGPTLNYNPGILLPDEISAFMPEYDTKMIGLLTTLYDAIVPYSESRRTTGKTIKIENPVLNMILGTTPSNLLKYLPEFAWEQGFTSRVILVYSPKTVGYRDRFAVTVKRDDETLLHDLECINRLEGEFFKEQAFLDKLNAWGEAGYPPEPTHRRLELYNNRRWGHTVKLAMVSSADRGDSGHLTSEDFDRAKGWLLEAEARMPQIFEKGIPTTSTAANEDLIQFLKGFNGATIREEQVKRKAMTLMPIYAIKQTIEIFVESGIISVVKTEKNGQRVFKASHPQP